jgi:hypothetical protein
MYLIRKQCCKRGDGQTAKALFDEMTALPDFVPRVPPYNTMLQFFVSTQPDRDEALHYFKRMLSDNVRPTEHTYKLLLDCYGQLEPVDPASLRDVFRRLEEDRTVQVESVHWASLLLSYGIEQKNPAEAHKIFASIPNHPSQPQGTPQDVTCFEAILNVSLANGEYDKVEEYAALMAERRVHSNAYVEAVRIKASSFISLAYTN